MEEPIGYDYGVYRVLKAGPWTQGLVASLQLAIPRGFELDKLRPTDPEFIHWVVEASKLVFADREAFYGDPKFVEVPVATLLSDDYNADRRALIGEQASLELRSGTVAGFDGRVDARVSTDTRVAVGASGAGELTVGRLGSVGGDTVHFDIVDEDGI